MPVSGDGARHRIVRLAEVGSTNSEALRRAAMGEAGPLWIAAERQIAGRGRSGRAWDGLPGNLFATLLMSPECAIARIGELALVAGLAAHDAASAALAHETPASAAGLKLKWPNDLECDGAKLAGILCESVVVAAGARVAIG
ncbi:MAG TPA: biotin--[acetyl-CoA-carboxylase] ligase, partial [Hyphomicrobiaceae bacterium]|nr:biotin--[acetyl-CoA-carboxylase] ligase [Hyphomicrobiaceae bacterium]